MEERSLKSIEENIKLNLPDVPPGEERKLT